MHLVDSRKDKSVDKTLIVMLHQFDSGVWYFVVFQCLVIFIRLEVSDNSIISESKQVDNNS